MKIRSGFVSNSSSSSFLILGRVYDISQKTLLPSEEKWMEIEKRSDIHVEEGYGENGIPDGKIVVGVYRECDSYTDPFSDEELDVNVVSDKLDAEGFPTGSMKVFLGTIIC